MTRVLLPIGSLLVVVVRGAHPRFRSNSARLVDPLSHR
jgi:hypothetical protein